MMKKNNYHRGFTLTEILIVISILALLSTLILSFFVDYRNKYGLTQDTDLIVQLLYKARNDSVVSNGSSAFGVHFASTSIVTFKGVVYNPSDITNQTFILTTTNYIAQVSLISGGVDIVFNQLTGETSGSGTIKLVSGATNASTTITVYPTGLIE